MAEHWMDKLHGGLADKDVPSDFDPAALKAGIEVEMEHTDDPHVAEEIAMDHLSEDPEYYEKLKKVEKEATMPRMSEVFQGRQLEAAQDRGPQKPDGEMAGVDEAQRLKPQFEKLVKEFAAEIMYKVDVAGGDPKAGVEDLLRQFASELEEAEGEDPGEVEA